MVCYMGSLLGWVCHSFLGLPSLPPAPQILLHPYDIWNVTGQDVTFWCEVFAYPMASIEWRKDAWTFSAARG